MEQLDGDSIRLTGRDGAAKRDIVQFVQMNQFSGLGCGARLAKEVLHELPTQVVQHFLAQGRLPPPMQAPPPPGMPPPGVGMPQQGPPGIQVNVQMPAAGAPQQPPRYG